jgi:alpha-galactosidase
MSKLVSGSQLVVAVAILGLGCSESASPPGPSAGGSSPGGSASGGASGSGGSKAIGGAPQIGGFGGTAGAAGSSGSGAGGAVASAGNGGGAVNGGASAGGGASGGASGKGGAGGAGGNGGQHAGGMAGAGGSGGGGGARALGATPPMGWNSWNAYNCNGLNEAVVKSMADAFITTGMKDVGYEYVNLDDCWMDGRDANGKLKWNASKFPSGIPALAEYIHSKGLKIGIYETPNTKTCAGIYGGYTPGVGSLGHETTDAQTFAAWGIDYLKYDKCQGQLSAFAVMRDALKATGRPIFYSINPGDQGPFCTPTNCSLNLPATANMWRVAFDISAQWGEVIRCIDANKEQYAGAGPGHWNDPDMLEVGNGLNDVEGRAHFSMWAIMAAPLITGNDLTKMSAATKATLTNAEVIAVDQDPLGKQGRVVATPGSNLEVWSKEMTGTNVRAVALFNRGSAAANITVQWSQIGLPTGAASVRDLWAAKDLGPFTGSYTATSVPSHSVVMLKIVSVP